MDEKKIPGFETTLRELAEWAAKVKIIKRQLELAEKYLTKFVIVEYGVFLLKSQLVEYELKYLLTDLDLHLRFSNASTILKIHTRKPNELEGLNLGNLITEIKKIEGELLKNLIKDLNVLNGERRMIAHYLFDLKYKIRDLNSKCEHGIKLTNQVLNEIEKIKKELDKNDPLSKV